ARAVGGHDVGAGEDLALAVVVEIGHGERALRAAARRDVRKPWLHLTIGAPRPERGAGRAEDAGAAEQDLEAAVVLEIGDGRRTVSPAADELRPAGIVAAVGAVDIAARAVAVRAHDDLELAIPVQIRERRGLIAEVGVGELLRPARPRAAIRLEHVEA